MEKFFDIVCSSNTLHPELVVMVATIQALKIHGGCLYENVKDEDLESLQRGFSNLDFHINNVKKFSVDCIVSINVHPSDTRKEIELLEKHLNELHIRYAVNTSYSDGKDGAIALANITVEALEKNNSNFTPLYIDDESIYTKIYKIATNIYNSTEVIYSQDVKEQIDKLEKTEVRNYKICISKTPMSISDDPHLLNVPENKLHINSIKIYHGAKFLVLMTGSIIAMPGLNKNPKGKNMRD